MKLAVVAALVVGCGDNLDVPTDILAQLQALPGVTAHEVPTQDVGYRYYVLELVQPVDHGAPGQTFHQEVSLLHRDVDAPMVVHTSGYWDYYLDHTVEPTRLLDANQISIEHRFFGTSRPDPADWTKLTIEQMADDEHAIVSALKTIYPGAYISTGGSKGGMTALFYRRFYPDDVAGTVAYVAPISFGVPDLRYEPFVDDLGPDDCRARVVAVATEMLANRRTQMEAHAMAQAAANQLGYTRVAIGPGVESAIDELEWSFWQYFGIDSCPNVPAVTDSDDVLFDFLDAVSPPSDNDDAQIALFDAYYYQSDFQLGFPEGGAHYLDSLLRYHDADYNGALPTPEPPAYDGAVAMDDIASFVGNAGDHLILVYGQWDPWTGGAFQLGNATDSLELVQPQGTHGSHITTLDGSDSDAALAKLAAWTGVTPQVAITPRVAVPTLERVHVPPAMRRARR
jgi:hypothetical protein